MFQENPMQHSIAARVSTGLSTGYLVLHGRKEGTTESTHVMLSARAIAPGSVVIVRDEEWLVTKMESTDGVTLLSVPGLSELVRGTRATFLDSLDEIEVFDPATTSLVADDSPSYRAPDSGSRRT